ncbi:MAG: C1 family peptidase [Bacteroidota bacterium]|nr:C1 family peptidase [Bacteroidota bacterium]
MMKKLSLVLVALMLITLVETADAQSEFKIVKEVKTTSVKNQQQAGTCWAYATISFLETELLRMDKGEFDLSEMYVVNKAYQDKAKNYVRLHGNAVFSQGGQAHDVTNAIKISGIIPEKNYRGLNYGTENHIHSEMEAVLKGMLENIVKNKNKKLTTVWDDAIEAVLNVYLGEIPEKIEYKNNKFTPMEFTKEIALNMDDYIEITSYTDHPFYEKYVLKIPDNWSSDLYYNVPLNELMDIMEYAITKGYSVCWDGDVSGNFKRREGYATLENEKEITQEIRQEYFDNYTATDDHLMHLTGIAKDENGKKYFKTKNSWSANSKYDGYWFMSFPFVELNTVAIMIHKDALPKGIKTKLGLY